MKLCELKINDMQSVKDITHSLLLNGYEVQAATVHKEFPYSGIDYFVIGIFEKEVDKQNDFKE